MAIQERTQKRLPPEVFDLPVEKMREGYYADAYFNHARSTLLHDGRQPRVVMQVFQKRDAYLGGMDESIAILKLCSYDWDELTVHALYDGDRVAPWETVMTIEGDYTLFAHLETAYLGVLARRTLITTNVVRVLEAAQRKADHLHACAARSPPRADGRRVCRTCRGPRGRRADRRYHRRAGLLVGRTRHRHGPALADRVLRRQHGARRDEVRGVGLRRRQHHGARRLREQFRADGARRCANTRPEAVGRAPRHIGDARRPVAVGGAGRLQADGRQRTARAQGARRTRQRRFRAREDRRLRRLHDRQDSSSSRRRACRSMRTASARR